MARNSELPKLENLRLIVVILTLAVWMVVLTNPAGFFPDPTDSAIPAIYAVEKGLAVVAWVLLAVGPLAITWAFGHGDIFVLRYMPYAALAWPVSVIAIQITAHQLYGEWYISYYQSSPAFFITDLLAPLGFYWVFTQLRLILDFEDLSAKLD